MINYRYAPLLGVSMLLCCLHASSADSVLVHYWQPDGTTSLQSKDSAKAMRSIAKDKGYVTLWLLLNYPFNVYLDDMSQEEIDIQNSEVASRFDEILDPLVDSGDVWHRSEGPFIRGPGIAVRATDKGLRSLLRDQRILQITATDE